MEITTQLISNCESLNHGEKKNLKVNGGVSVEISRRKGGDFWEVYVLTKSRSILVSHTLLAGLSPR